MCAISTFPLYLLPQFRVLLRLHVSMHAWIASMASCNELVCLCAATQEHCEHLHTAGDTSPSTSTHGDQHPSRALDADSSLNSSITTVQLSSAPTCLSISSPSTRKDRAFLGSKQTVVLATHNLHTNKKPELVRKGPVFRIDLMKHYRQTN